LSLAYLGQGPLQKLSILQQKQSFFQTSWMFSKDWGKQWRTQKIFMGVSFSGIWWSFLFGVCGLWRQNVTSYSCFQTNVFAKFI